MNDRMKVCMNERMTVVCMYYYLNGNKHIKEKKKFTSNLRRRRTIPVTAGGCQVSGKGYKGGAKGTARGARGLSKGSKEKCAMYICNHNVYAKE
jgi:hypothetical protein